MEEGGGVFIGVSGFRAGLGDLGRWRRASRENDAFGRVFEVEGGVIEEITQSSMYKISSFTRHLFLTGLTFDSRLEMTDACIYDPFKYNAFLTPLFLLCIWFHVVDRR